MSLHMVVNNGNNEGLFRGAVMESGSPIPVGNITLGQQYFDAFVSQTGCSAASDKLECLRGVPYDNYTAAVQASPNGYSYQVSYTCSFFACPFSDKRSRFNWLGCPESTEFFLRTILKV